MIIIPSSTPGSRLRIMTGINLDNTYEHTIFWDKKEPGFEGDVTSQIGWFLHSDRNVLGDYDEYTYVKGTNSIKVNDAFSKLYTANYMMFKNTNHENKWYFAFVINVEYVNEETTIITYEIDVMQTFHFDYVLNQCFIDREHVKYDGSAPAGEEWLTTPLFTEEGLEIGPYRARNIIAAGIMQQGAAICIASTINYDGTDVTGGLYAGIYSGLRILKFTSAANVNAFIQQVVTANKQDSIVSIFMMPNLYFREMGESLVAHTVDIPGNTNFGGYEPKNYKLFTWPYNILHVENLQGSCGDFRYEHFGLVDGKCRFVVMGTTNPDPEIFTYPKNYENEADAYSHGLSIKCFPQCSYITDTYKAWLAQNASSLSVQMMANSLSGPGKIYGAWIEGADNISEGTGFLDTISRMFSFGKNMKDTLLNLNTYDKAGLLNNPLGGQSAYIATQKLLAQKRDISTLPPQAKGQSGSNILFSWGDLDFRYKQLSITPYYAQQIDNYFQMFGYKSGLVKVPNRDIRPYFTYTKTVNCLIDGNLPASFDEKIRSIYNKGITFWQRYAQIGNYDVDNSPGGGVG